MKILITICGIYSLVFAIFHFFFWKLFNWKTELKKLSFVNKAVMQMLNIQLIIYFLFVAAICFLFPSELLTTKIGQFVLATTAVFWLVRTIEQFIFLRANHYKIHLLTVIFFIGVVLFALPVIL